MQIEEQNPLASWVQTSFIAAGDVNSRTVLCVIKAESGETMLLMTPDEAREAAADLIAQAAKAEGL